MKIQCINLYQNNSVIKKSNINTNVKRNDDLPFYGLPKINKPENIILKQIDEDYAFRKFINSKGKVTLKEYTDIKKNHPQTLVKCYKMCEDNETIFAHPETFAKASIALKEHYDKLYGNYTILSVGTSPAPFVEIMENLGCKVIYLPITHLNRLEESSAYIFGRQYPTIASRHPNINTLMKYCTKKGISKKDKGELIILDFSYTGKTTDLIEKILNERNDIPPEKLHKHCIVKDLHSLENQPNKSQLDATDTSIIDTEIRLSHYEEISNVPHFMFNGDETYDYAHTVRAKGKRSRQIFKEFDEYSTPLGRAWSLCAINEALKI